MPRCTPSQQPPATPPIPNHCLHCSKPASSAQVSCDSCGAYICPSCHWCHEFQANHSIRVCDRCDAFYCRACDPMDQCSGCSEVICSCSTLLNCKFCGEGLCEDCATTCGKCGIVLCLKDKKFSVECDTCGMGYCLVCLAGGREICVRCGRRMSGRVGQLVNLRLKSIYRAFKGNGEGSEARVCGTREEADRVAEELVREVEEESRLELEEKKKKKKKKAKKKAKKEGKRGSKVPIPNNEHAADHQTGPGPPSSSPPKTSLKNPQCVAEKPNSHTQNQNKDISEKIQNVEKPSNSNQTPNTTDTSIHSKSQETNINQDQTPHPVHDSKTTTKNENNYFENQIATIISKGDIGEIETQLSELRGIPGKAQARKALKKALKKLLSEKSRDTGQQQHHLHEQTNKQLDKVKQSSSTLIHENVANKPMDSYPPSIILPSQDVTIPSVSSLERNITVLPSTSTITTSNHQHHYQVTKPLMLSSNNLDIEARLPILPTHHQSQRKASSLSSDEALESPFQPFNESFHLFHHCGASSSSSSINNININNNANLIPQAAAAQEKRQSQQLSSLLQGSDRKPSDTLHLLSSSSSTLPINDGKKSDTLHLLSSSSSTLPILPTSQNNRCQWGDMASSDNTKMSDTTATMSLLPPHSVVSNISDVEKQTQLDYELLNQMFGQQTNMQNSYSNTPSRWNDDKPLFSSQQNQSSFGVPVASSDNTNGMYRHNGTHCQHQHQRNGIASPKTMAALPPLHSSANFQQPSSTMTATTGANGATLSSSNDGDFGPFSSKFAMVSSATDEPSSLLSLPAVNNPSLNLFQDPNSSNSATIKENHISNLFPSSMPLSSQNGSLYLNDDESRYSMYFSHDEHSPALQSSQGKVERRPSSSRVIPLLGTTSATFRNETTQEPLQHPQTTDKTKSTATYHSQFLAGAASVESNVKTTVGKKQQLTEEQIRDSEMIDQMFGSAAAGVVSGDTTNVEQQVIYGLGGEGGGLAGGSYWKDGEITITDSFPRSGKTSATGSTFMHMS